MSEILFAGRWYLVVQLFGLAALPLTRAWLRHLPDRGYGLSKALGLLLAGWLYWMLGTFGWLHNTSGGVCLALALLLGAGILLQVVRNPRSDDTGARQSTVPWRIILMSEAVFAIAFVAWCLVRARMPDIMTAGGEKWMESAFLRAILRSDGFPPHDPWMSGFGISYYYFGYVIVAMVTQLAAVPPAIAFNLAVAMLFALVCQGAYSLVFNLIAAGDERRDRAAAPGHLVGGLLGPLLLAAMGNLEGLLEVLYARGHGASRLSQWFAQRFWPWLDVRSINTPPGSAAQGGWIPSRFFWWWQASRVVHDYSPLGETQEVIDEFPAFSFILGDLHPHVLALPFILLAIGLALNLYLGVRHGAVKGQQGGGLIRWLQAWPFTTWEFVLAALCLGGLGFLNTWDFPIYLFVVAAALALAVMGRERRPLRDVLTGAVLVFGALAVAGVLVYLPFWLGFQSQAGGALINLFNATRLPQFLVMFAPLLFINAALVISAARQVHVRVLSVVAWTLAVLSAIAALIALLVGVMILMIRLGDVPPTGVASYVWAWLTGASVAGLGEGDIRGIVAQALVRRLTNPWTAVGLLALLSGAVLTLVHRLGGAATSSVNAAAEPRPLGQDFVLLLIATGALLTVSVEFVYLRDHFGTRMN
ncbi:MAG: hypothetical protein GX601_07795, partial [Anaerolineales bacterium]|nr:hypothetical protein [Anaerolineales bacterium]